MFDRLRKFKTEYSDLPTMLDNVSFFLRLLTLDIDGRYTRPVPIIFYVITMVIAASYFYVYLISMSWFVFCRTPETGDVFSGLVILSLGISSEIGTTKLIFMYLNINKIRKLVVDYFACDALVEPGSRFSNNMMKTLTLVKKRAIIFWIVIIGNGVFYVLKALVMPGRHLMEDRFVIYGLEPIYETPNFQVAFTMMSFGVFFTCYLPANITALLIVLAGYVEAQMLALSEEMLSLVQDAANFCRNIESCSSENLDSENQATEINVNDKKVTNEYMNQRLTALIKIHAMNINLSKQLEIIFAGAVAVEFMLLMLALIVELLAGLEKTYIQLPFALMQVGMDCLTGQRLMDASLVFERAVYGCNWQEFDTSNMKMVLLILQNSQKTLTLSAGGITMLSFSCMMSVIRSIYSAYTTLRTTMNDRNM